MNKYEQVKIFIPTKGRLDDEKTYNNLVSLGLEPILVIEPQEVEQAAFRGYKGIVLPANNMGITYSRNYILKKARDMGYEYICMIDDDVSQMGYIVDGKRVKDNNAFLTALDKFLEFKTCGTMQYNQFAWCQPKPIVYNRGLEVVWFLYMPQLQNVTIEEDTIEDRDFSLDIIINHNVETFRLNHLYFNVLSIGANKGGIETSTRAEKQAYWSRKMQQKWGENIISIIQKTNGWDDIKINWRQVDKIIKEKRACLQNPESMV